MRNKIKTHRDRHQAYEAGKHPQTRTEKDCDIKILTHTFTERNARLKKH